MVKVKKKYQEGASKTYITRSRAIKKLQISIADFRRLCIFKGIYPREPLSKKRANKGNSAPNIFYYTKDIQYLLHEPIINKFRQDKIFARKLSRALVRGELDDAKRLDSNRPKYNLNHIIKERYPTFIDAVRDLDDPLSMIFLFAIMPATDSVSYRVTQKANRLCNEWMAYVAREKLLRKVFVSIKGIYYQANIKGQDVLWLVPFDFPQNVPTDIDFRVMLSFLELYTTLIQFVLFKLYNGSGLVYPPKVDEAKLKGVGGLSAFILNSREEEGAKSLKSLTGTFEKSEEEAQEEDDDEEEEDGKKSQKPTLSSEEIAKIAKEDANADDDMEDISKEDDEDTVEEADKVKLDEFKPVPSTQDIASDELAQPTENSGSEIGSLFKNKVIFVGREVPAKVAEFLIISCGGQVILESALDEAIANEETDPAAIKKKQLAKQAQEELLKKVTHQISDRPAIPNRVPGRVYVQPQWIFDSINQGKLLPVSEYALGAKLPPHLSPWGDRSGYDPESKAAEDEDEEDEDSESEAEEDEDEEEVAAEEDDEEDEEAKELQDDLKKEAKGIPFSEDSQRKKNKKKNSGDKKRSKEEMEEEEIKNMKVSMMSNKQRKIYQELKEDVDKKEQAKEKLIQKKKKLQSKLKNNKKK